MAGTMRNLMMIGMGLLVAAAGWAEFTLEDNGSSETVIENGKPVLTYNYARVAPPANVPDHFGRACYLHPVYGLDGDVMTQDFPVDHYHHRGVFWAWPECTVGGRRMDVWALDDVRQHHEKWTAREADADKAHVGVVNSWAFDDAPDKPQVREEVDFTVRPADATGRAIDFRLKMTNVSDKPVTFLGAKDKGYGGFCFRPDANRKPFTFTTAKGVCAEDALSFETPWADMTSRAAPDGPISGAAIFEHPSNPGYPFPGWIFRHYGFLGASWPHEKTHALAPGESFELQYRLYLHRGTAEEAKVAEKFEAYIAGLK